MGILGVTDEPLVSSDFRGDSRSAIVDARSTMVVGGTLVKVAAWYDNEWAYSCRIADLVSLVASGIRRLRADGQAVQHAQRLDPVGSSA